MKKEWKRKERRRFEMFWVNSLELRTWRNVEERGCATEGSRKQYRKHWYERSEFHRRHQSQHEIKRQGSGKTAQAAQSVGTSTSVHFCQEKYRLIHLAKNHKNSTWPLQFPLHGRQTPKADNRVFGVLLTPSSGGDHMLRKFEGSSEENGQLNMCAD